MDESRSKEVSWSVELALASRQLDAFRELTMNMAQAARNEPGTLLFERFVSEDHSTIHLYERYVDSEAAILHLLGFRNRFACRFAKLVERRTFSLYGDASPELIEILNGMLAPSRPQHFSRIDCFRG